MAKEAENTEEGKVVELPVVELDAEEISAIEQSVISQNEGKTKEELADEIAAATETHQKGQAAILVKLDEIKLREGNAGMSDEDAFAIFETESEAEEEEVKAVSSDPFAGITPTSEANAGTDSPEILSERLRAYEAKLSNPIVKEFVEFVDNGGDIASFIAQTGRVVDYSKLSPKDVFEEYLTAEVLSGQMTDEEKETEMSLFDSEESIIKKKALVAPLRQELAARQQEKLSKFMSQPARQRQDMEEVNRKAEAELNLFTDNLKGKNYAGWDIPETVLLSAKNDLKTGKFSFVNQDGSPNVGLMVKAYIAVNHMDDIRKANIEKGRVKGVRLEVKKRTLPKRGTGVTTRALDTSGSLDQKFQEEKRRRKAEKGIIHNTTTN